MLLLPLYSLRVPLLVSVYTINPSGRSPSRISTTLFKSPPGFERISIISPLIPCCCKSSNASLNCFVVTSSNCETIIYPILSSIILWSTVFTFTSALSTVKVSVCEPLLISRLTVVPLSPFISATADDKSISVISVPSTFTTQSPFLIPALYAGASSYGSAIRIEPSSFFWHTAPIP